MGWLFMHKPKGMPVCDWLVQSGGLRWSDDLPNTYKVLDSATINCREFYAAVERTCKETGEREVWAAVFLLQFTKGHHNFGYKDMDETMGPVVANCPERILKLLTPTDNEHAKDWRQRCWANVEIARRAKALAPKDEILLYGRWYVIESLLGSKGFLIRGKDSRIPYKLTPYRARQIEEIRHG